MTSHVELAEAGFDPAARLAAFTASLDGEGAVVSFTGHARGAAKDGRPVAALVNGVPRCSEIWWPKKSKSTQVSVLRPSVQPSTPP